MKKRFQKLMGMLVLGAMATGLVVSVSALEAKAEEAPYRIAMVGPLTGPGMQYGQAYKNTLEIERDKINEEGGINGHPIEIDFYDDKQDPKETLNVANLVVADGNYVAVIGSQTSSCSMAAAPVLQRAGIPMIAPHASHADYAKMGDYCFTLQMPNSYESRVQNEWAIDYLGATKAAIIYSNDDWGLQNLDSITAACENKGIELVAAETFIANTTKDFSPLITKVKEADPDYIYIAVLYSDGCLLVPQMKSLELDCTIVAPNTLYRTEFLEVVGEDAEGIIIPNNYSTLHHSADYEYIEKAYAEKVEGGIVDSYVSHSYDALAILANAMREAGDDREGIKNYLQNMGEYEGVAGTFRFNSDGATMKNIYIMRIENGEFVEDPDIVIVPEE